MAGRWENDERTDVARHRSQSVEHHEMRKLKLKTNKTENNLIAKLKIDHPASDCTINKPILFDSVWSSTAEIRRGDPVEPEKRSSRYV
jgi:hypothetical protein